MYIYRADVLLSFICVLIHACAFPSSQAQECGDNPIKQVLLVAKSTGRLNRRTFFIFENNNSKREIEL